MRKSNIVLAAVILLCIFLLSGQISRRQAFSYRIFPSCGDAKSFAAILDLNGGSMTWVTDQTVDIGYGFKLTINPMPDSSGQISLKSRPYLLVRGPGIHQNGKAVYFNWVNWSPPAANSSTYAGYTFLRASAAEKVVSRSGMTQYTLEFPAGYHYAQPTSATPGRDWHAYFCYKGPSVRRVLIKK